MKQRKITITTGSRSEYGILRPVLTKLQNNKHFKPYLLVTGTHLSKKYGHTISEIKKDGFKPYSTFSLIPSGNDNYYMTKSVGDGILKFAKIFRKIKPDINLILGDRAEMLASAIAAYYMNIPNAHIHGGDVSGSIDEYTRHAITKISNIHFAATAKSYNRIIKMGENPKFVFLTGSPSIDEISLNKISTKNQLYKKYNLNVNNETIILLYHPLTTELLKTKKEIKNILNAITKINHQTIIISPNSDTGRKIIYDYLKNSVKKSSFLHLYPTFPRHDFLGLLKHAGVLVGNSSSGIIEANYLGIPVVNIGKRQHNREKTKNVFDVEGNSEKLIKNLIINTLRKKSINSKYLYGRGNASKKIMNILEKIRLDNDLIQKELFY
ncbi:MAG: UDP-N-acetylglucosamine 2-epimerase (hydrolyzing) [Thaumarchaeota archaeon]|nr:MAG: UDP-N-acetylglucosamine 2-epimerase (hydrolyzing) [Nitrososphaerota archaeon]